MKEKLQNDLLDIYNRRFKFSPLGLSQIQLEQKNKQNKQRNLYYGTDQYVPFTVFEDRKYTLPLCIQGALMKTEHK